MSAKRISGAHHPPDHRPTPPDRGLAHLAHWCSRRRSLMLGDRRCSRSARSQLPSRRLYVNIRSGGVMQCWAMATHTSIRYCTVTAMVSASRYCALCHCPTHLYGAQIHSRSPPGMLLGLMKQYAASIGVSERDQTTESLARDKERCVQRVRTPQDDDRRKGQPEGDPYWRLAEEVCRRSRCWSCAGVDHDEWSGRGSCWVHNNDE